MLVEDDIGLSHALERVLNVAEFRTVCFDSAESFLKVSGLIRPSCLVVDVQLPGINGFELREALAKVFLPVPPVIFITAHDEPDARLRASAADAAAFLVKPFTGRTLVNLVREIVNKPPPPEAAA